MSGTDGGAHSGRSRAGPARRAAHRILLRVSEEAAWASRLLEALDEESLDLRDVALIHELVLGVLRWRARLDDRIRRACRRPLDKLDPSVREALRLGAYQLLFLDRVPPTRPWTSPWRSLARRRCRDGKGNPCAPPRRGAPPQAS